MNHQKPDQGDSSRHPDWLLTIAVGGAVFTVTLVAWLGLLLFAPRDAGGRFAPEVTAAIQLLSYVCVAVALGLAGAVGIKIRRP